MLSEPYLVADLPHSLFGQSQEAQSCEIFNINGDRRRQRPEVAVAVDGAGLSIFDVSAAHVTWCNG